MSEAAVNFLTAVLVAIYSFHKCVRDPESSLLMVGLGGAFALSGLFLLVIFPEPFLPPLRDIVELYFDKLTPPGLCYLFGAGTCLGALAELATRFIRDD